MHLRK